jgi:superfamily II DNA or RNA helicase
MSIKIPIPIISKENIDYMEKKLMIAKEIPKGAPSFYHPPKIPFFRKHNQDLCIPFHWGKSYFSSKYIPCCSSYPFSFQGELRPEQNMLQMEAIEMLQENNSCLLAVYPGGGKTITALSLLPHLKRKTLIIVNKLVLVEQWKDSIERFLGVTPFVIGGIHSKIQSNSILIINAINIPKHDFSKLDIGCVIVDECHLILSTVFSQGLLHLSPEYLIGCSATPYRSDGFNELFDIYFGVHRIERSLYKTHDVLQVMSQEDVPHELDRNGKINWNSVIQKQSISTFRQKLIVDYCLEYSNRNILILCKRIQQMTDLHHVLREKDQYVCIFKENDVNFDRDCRILVSSFQKVGTGFSFDKLDMLILGTDTEEYFLQYLGRVFRRTDVRPLIIDIVDNHPVLMKHFRSRKKIYKSCGGIIKKISFEKKNLP